MLREGRDGARVHPITAPVCRRAVLEEDGVAHDRGGRAEPFRSKTMYGARGGGHWRSEESPPLCSCSRRSAPAGTGGSFIERDNVRILIASEPNSRPLCRCSVLCGSVMWRDCCLFSWWIYSTIVSGVSRAFGFMGVPYMWSLGKRDR